MAQYENSGPWKQAEMCFPCDDDCKEPEPLEQHHHRGTSPISKQTCQYSELCALMFGTGGQPSCPFCNE